MKDNYLTISEFSKISEISRKALIFYDNIGLFSPEYTAPNGYRYYSHEQIYVISVITLLKELGMPLSEIKFYMAKKNIHQAISLLSAQDKVIDAKIAELKNAQNMLLAKLDSLITGSKITDYQPYVVVQDEQPLYISRSFQMTKSDIPDEIWVNYYMDCKRHGILFGFPEGFLVTKEMLLARKSNVARNIIFHVNNRSFSNGVMPKGRYLTAYGHGGLEETESIYQKLFQYIEKEHIVVVGNAYEKRLIDEIATEEKNQQLIEVKIHIL